MNIVFSDYNYAVRNNSTKSGCTPLATGSNYCTVTVALPVFPPKVAEIVAVPVETAVTNPVLFTVAIVVSLEFQVAEFVTLLVVLSEKVAVAVSC